MNEDLQKMFVEDAPQQVNELNNVESLSSHVLELQKLEDEIKIEEERLSRKKNDSSFPNLSLKKIKTDFNIKFQEIEAIVFYEKPFLNDFLLCQPFFLENYSSLIRNHYHQNHQSLDLNSAIIPQYLYRY